MARFVPRPGFRREAVRDPDVTAAMAAVGRVAMAYAQTIAPVVSGNYRASFSVEETEDGARLVNSAPYAAKVERRHRVLSQTVDVIEGPL